MRSARAATNCKSFENDPREYQRLIEVFKAHDIGYFFYNGGGDSQDTANKVAQLSARLGYPITCIGVPKTVDNDLPFTDTCPGFGSVAKYVAVSIREAALDVASMCETSTKVFVMEVMGRHAGWIAAAAGLAQETPDGAPHVIVFPEIAFDRAAFIKKVDETVQACGLLRDRRVGRRASCGRHASSPKRARRTRSGIRSSAGLRRRLPRLVRSELGYKFHWAVADYLQRAARHIASATDVEQAYAVGRAAVEFAVAGKNAVMPIIVRKSSKPYRWTIGEAPLAKVANVEKKMPRNFITRDGFGITPKARDYLEPLIAGEDYPRYKNGLPEYVTLKNQLVPKKLARVLSAQKKTPDQPGFFEGSPIS